MNARLRARAHRTCGWIAYQLGWAMAARRQYERVLTLMGADFRAYVGLGRIAFDEGDYTGWRREFEYARRTDPIRFARLRHPLELFEPRLAGTPLDRRLRAEADASRHHTEAPANLGATQPAGEAPSKPGTNEDLALGADVPAGPDPALRSAEDDDRDIADLTLDHEDSPRARIPRPSPPDASVTRDDFSSPAERHRFQQRRPINRREIARCDLTDLARRLSG